MVIIFTHNNNNINGFDFEKMTWFLTKHINTCKVIYISISLTKLTLPQKSQLKLFLQNVIFFLQSFHNFWKNLCTQVWRLCTQLWRYQTVIYFLFCWFCLACTNYHFYCKSLFHILKKTLKLLCSEYRSIHIYSMFCFMKVSIHV